jgi:hypothetical protein
MQVKGKRKFKYGDSSGDSQDIDPGMVLDVPNEFAKNWIKWDGRSSINP